MKEPGVREMFMNGENAARRLEWFLDVLKASECRAPEVALYVSQVEELKNINLGPFHRIYFGAEFCEKNLPTPEGWSAAAAAASSAGLKATLITPYMTELGLSLLKELLLHVAVGDPETEVVVNDWGAFNFIRRELPTLRPVIGRVLIRQKKDPRIVHVDEEGMRSYFSRALLDNRNFTEFLVREGATRAELDNPPHGLDIGVSENMPQISLYYPYVFLTTSRQCAPGRCENCRNSKYVMRNSLIDRDIVYMGRSQFYVNTDLSALCGGKISRLVYQYTLPI